MAKSTAIASTSVANVIDLEARKNAKRKLAGYAKRLFRMREQIFDDAMEMGRILVDAREAVKEAGVRWYDWLDKCGITHDLAEKLMKLHKFINDETPNRFGVDLATMADKISLKAFYLLAAPSTSDETRQDIINRAQQGEVINSGTVRRTRDASSGGDPVSPESPQSSNQAKQEGEPQGGPAASAPLPSVQPDFASGQEAGGAAHPAQQQSVAAPPVQISQKSAEILADVLSRVSLIEVAKSLGEERFAELAGLFGYVKNNTDELQQELEQTKAELAQAKLSLELHAKVIPPAFTAEAFMKLPDKAQDEFVEDLASNDKWRSGPLLNDYAWKKVRWATTLYAYLPTETAHRAEFKRVIKLEMSNAPPETDRLRKEAAPKFRFSEGFE